MRQITRILVAVDLTETRDAAFDRALAIASRERADLFLVHAVPANRRFSWGAVARFERTNDLRRRAEAEGLNVRVAEQQGDPAGVIALHADARDADLIVLGTNNRSGWERLREGSVAERVLRRTSRPVLLVPSDGSGGGHLPFRNIVVGSDFSPAMAANVEAAMRLAGGAADRLTVLHVVNGVEAEQNMRSASRWAVPEYRRHLIHDAKRRLEAAVPSRVRAAANVQTKVVTGVPHQAILAYASEVNADLVVVGASARFMHLGSAAARVLRRSDRPLLVVPAQSSVRRVFETEKSERPVAA
jgi:nucleotide-binding universal stress UspA family protein